MKEAAWMANGNSRLMPRSRRRLRFATLADVPSEVDRLVQGGYRMVGAWSLAQVLNHLAGSIVYTIEGFPGPAAPWIVQDDRRRGAAVDADERADSARHATASRVSASRRTRRASRSGGVSRGGGAVHISAR